MKIKIMIIYLIHRLTFRKRKGPFSKHYETEEDLQQANKKRTTETHHTESSHGGKGGGYNMMRHNRAPNVGTKTLNLN